MTYTIKTTRVQTPANGVATTFPFGFRVLAASDLYVALVDDAGAETAQVLDSDYTVSTGPWTSGGSIVFSSAPTDDYDVLIERRTPLEQTEAFLAGGSFNAARVMGVLDKLVMLIQEARREVSDIDTVFDGLTMADIAGLVAALAAKAPLDSPALTGTPTAPTATPGTNSTQLATTAFVQAVVAALVDGAPGALDTLDELAAAMGDDPNFATTVTNALAGKLAIANNLSDLNDAATARTNLGLGAIALKASLVATDISNSTTVGRSLMTAIDAAAGRTALGLGTMATQTAANYALLAGPAFTGTPTAPTAALNTNSTQIATTAYVLDAITNGSTFTQTGTGAVSRTLGAKLSEAPSVFDFGAAGDGSSDDVAEFDAAVTAHPRVRVPKPTAHYKLPTVLSAPSIVLEGVGPASDIRRPAGALAGPAYVFSSTDRLELRNLSIDMAVDTTATNGVNLFNASTDNVLLDGVTIDANCTISGVDGSRSHLANWTTVGSGVDVSGWTIRYSTLRGFFWGILHANTTVATIKDISIEFSKFEEHGSTYLLFNAPASGALYENVQIIGNKLGAVNSNQPFDGTDPGYPHRGSFAGHVEYARLIGNHATGYGGEFFRSEEAARGVIMALNTARLEGKDGIEIIPNNAGGTLYTPSLFVVSGNILDHRGLTSAPTKEWGIGLHTYTSLPGREDAECLHDSAVYGNVVRGWGQALSLHYGMQRDLVFGNVLADSTIGIRTYAPSLGTKDNLIVDCPTAVSFDASGMLGAIHLRSDDADGALQAIAVSTTVGAVTEWTWETGRFTVPNGFTDVELLNKGSRFDGEIIAMISKANVYCVEKGRLKWDGTTLTYTQYSRFTAGAVVFASVTPFLLTSSDTNLSVRIYNALGVASDGFRLQVKFSGIHVWA